MVWLQSQISVGMVFLAGAGADQGLGLAGLFWMEDVLFA
jgi:hypothetical protein